MRSASSTQFGGVQMFERAGNLGVALLHRHDFLDVLDVLAQQRRPRSSISVCSPAKLVGHRAEIFGQEFAFRVGGQEFAEVAVLLAQHGGGAAQIGELGLPQPVADEGGGDADAVEHVADVVQDAGGHFGHAGLARGFEQPAVEPVQFVRPPFSAR